jgi:hypothetical protein
MNLGYCISEKKSVPFVNERPFSHTHLIGKKGVGKTTALMNYVLQDIENGDRAVFIDLDGAATEEILLRVPEDRAEDITFLDFTEHPPTLNLFYDISQEHHARVAGALVNIAGAVWDYGGTPTPRLDLHLRAAARAILSQRNGTLLDIYYLLTDENRRKQYLKREKDEIVKNMWQRFGEKDSREQNTNIESTLTRIFEIVSDPLVREIVGHYRTSFDLKNTKILLASIPERVFGRDISRMLGCFLLALIQQSREPFRIYLDQADRFAPSQLIELLDSNCAMTLAHRYLEQLDDRLRAAVLGTVGTVVCFQIGPEDVDSIQPLLEFRSQVRLGFNNNSVHFLSEIPPFYAYARTERVEELYMPDLSAETNPKAAEAIRQRCRSQHAGRRELGADT